MVQILANRRIVLDPAPRRGSPPPLEAVLLGHCPGQVRPGRLSQHAREQLRHLGFGAVADALPAAPTSPGLDTSDNVAVAEAPPDILTADALLLARTQRLRHLPLAFSSLAEFSDCFPDAAQTPCGYRSTLAGDLAWLPSAVEDFFRVGGRALWVIVIDEGEAQRGFLPRAGAVSLSQPTTLRGVELVGLLAQVAVVALPDLERLQIPAELPDVPLVRLPNPAPVFLPCAGATDDDTRERRPSAELVQPEPPLAFATVVRPLLAFLARWRPDVQLLLTVPLRFADGLERPALDEAAVTNLAQAADDLLRHLQPVFPYLRDARRPLTSATGLIAGGICAHAAQRSPWASLAGQRLASSARPYPEPQPIEVARLREDFDLGVLISTAGGVQLDDERTPCRAFSRSAEVVRFIGWLRRQLTELGNQLVFSVDPHDPRPELALRQFFSRLHQAGALRGRTSEEAYTLEVSQPGEGQVVFTILIAPAFPIDRITLTLLADQGRWSVEVDDG